MSRKDLSLATIFAVPAMLAVLALIGLIGALLEDGPWDAIGAVLLGLFAVSVVWARVRARKRN